MLTRTLSCVDTGLPHTHQEMAVPPDEMGDNQCPTQHFSNAGGIKMKKKKKTFDLTNIFSLTIVTTANGEIFVLVLMSYF